MGEKKCKASVCEQASCRILVFASRRANKVAKWKIGLTHEYSAIKNSLTRSLTQLRSMTREYTSLLML